MKVKTYSSLHSLHEKYGPREFGKICQKLLAIAFCLAGYGHVVERGVQGVDVDAAQDGKGRLSVEVKTTVKDSVVFGVKDRKGLLARAKDGYRPLLAVLQIGPLSEWYLADASTLRVGKLRVESLRPVRLSELEKEISPRFEESVNEHYVAILQGGQSYLDKVLKSRGVQLEES